MNIDFILSPITSLALQFATYKHESINHRRKYTLDSYIVHPIAVAKIVSSISHTEEMITAALLHDVLEDTLTSPEEIYELFGEHILYYVSSLTDISSYHHGNRQIRKNIDREHISHACSEVQTIKLADLIDNTSTIVQYDKNFAKTYLQEKEYLLTVLTKGNVVLFHQAASLLQTAKQSLLSL